MLVYVYDIWLILASVAISMMAAFTGLALTRGLSRVPETTKQIRIIMAAVALGGGIWSMHFVAMLAMRFEVAVYYNPLQTVASVLIAILLAGVALLLMHFGARTDVKKTCAGLVLGIGICVMHYVGLSAIEGCAPVYKPAGFIVAGILAALMGVAAIRMAYAKRTGRNILLATLIFGGSVVVVHFAAMFWTGFTETASPLSGPALNNAELALIVLLSAFVISGAFLLSGASFLAPTAEPAAIAPATPTAPYAPEPQPEPEPAGARLPYEKDGKTFFVAASEIAAIRAEGHYTIAYTHQGRVFCPWSISEAEKRLPFFRAHRSYLVNVRHVSGFERNKDNGICLFESFPHLDKIPVSRTRVNELRDILGL